MSEETIADRVNENVVELLGYLNHPGSTSKKRTGYAIVLNKVQNMSVIEINVKIDEIRDSFIESVLSCLSENDIIVRTINGIHIYANTNDFIATKNEIRCYTSEEADVNI